VELDAPEAIDGGGGGIGLELDEGEAAA